MKDQLIHYVDLLFAGAPDTEDIKQEILQNTLDRYDDLIAQGKAPAAAYSLAIAGIGDVSELLGSAKPAEPAPQLHPANHIKPEYRSAPAWKKVLRAVAVCLYILSIIPLIVLAEFGMEILGLCGTLTFVGVATALLIIAGGKNSAPAKNAPTEPADPKSELRRAVKTTIRTVGLVVYFVVSFLTQAWYITWLIFPIMAAVNGIAAACMDLKEANAYEN